MLTSPAAFPTPVGCLAPEPCSEVLDAQCVIYTGDDILCNTDVVVNQNDSVDTALNEIVDYFCNGIPTQCCPTFAVDISFSEVGSGTLSTTLTNGTGPFTYEWTIEQSAVIGIAFTGPTNTSSVLIVTVLNNYVSVPALSGQSYSALVKVKVTDSVGQIATAYFNAVVFELPA
jgi:hypothetical protein